MKMNFTPSKDYDGLLAQAKAMYRIIEVMEKSKSIQGKVVDDLTRQLLICGKDHLESEREANQLLTDQVLRLEQERDQLKNENESLRETLFQVAEMLNIDYEWARKQGGEPSAVYRKYFAEHDAQVIEQAIPSFMDPSTNNGDWRKDAEFRMGWNACRDSMKNRANQLRQKAQENEND